MNIRVEAEKWEEKTLSPYAKLSINTKGRRIDEEPCSVRTEFQKDKDKILHSLSFRLLKHKTQVFLSTTGEEFRTRLTHTLEVASVGRYIARALNLNQDLVEAIALGHDLGHTPFGHTGEKVLDELTPFTFRHSYQSVRVVERIENNGNGLNLTFEVKDGIKGHSKGELSIYSIYRENLSGRRRTATIEGEVVQFADWIAYINHDIDDAFNMRVITKNDLPESSAKILGANFQQRSVTMIKDVIQTSYEKEHIRMSKEIMNATDELRKYLYEYVYKLPQISQREKIARKILTFIYNHYVNNYDLVLKEMPFLNKEKHERGTCDFVASLTDTRAQELYRKYGKKV